MGTIHCGQTKRWNTTQWANTGFFFTGSEHIPVVSERQKSGGFESRNVPPCFASHSFPPFSLCFIRHRRGSCCRCCHATLPWSWKVRSSGGCPSQRATRRKKPATTPTFTVFTFGSTGMSGKGCRWRVGWSLLVLIGWFCYRSSVFMHYQRHGAAQKCDVEGEMRPCFQGFSQIKIKEARCGLSGFYLGATE